MNEFSCYRDGSNGVIVVIDEHRPEAAVNARPLLLIAVGGLVTTLSSSARAAEPVGASRLLVFSPQAFRDTCLADIQKAGDAAARFKAGPTAPPLAALDEYDSAAALLA